MSDNRRRLMILSRSLTIFPQLDVSLGPVWLVTGDGVPGSTTAATPAGRTLSVTICRCTRDLSRFPMSGQASPAGERGTWGQNKMTVLNDKIQFSHLLKIFSYLAAFIAVYM